MYEDTEKARIDTEALAVYRYYLCRSFLGKLVDEGKLTEQQRAKIEIKIKQTLAA